MRDLDVRQVLREQLQSYFAHDPNTRIIEELGICQGSVRIDVAVANCALHGYEIKSAADTLQRLPAQADAYSRIFDHMTLVTASCHLDLTLQIIPSWWGIVRAIDIGASVQLEPLREAEPNPGGDLYSVAQLLWREEALDELERLGYAKGFKSKPREFVWKRLVEVADPGYLREQVRTRLKLRQGWRVVELPRSSDG